MEGGPLELLPQSSFFGTRVLHGPNSKLTRISQSLLVPCDLALPSVLQVLQVFQVFSVRHAVVRMKSQGAQEFHPSSLVVKDGTQHFNVTLLHLRFSHQDQDIEENVCSNGQKSRKTV